MAGLSWAARDIDTYLHHHPNSGIRHLHFFADNTSAIIAIFEAKAGPSQGHSWIFREFATHFLEADQNHTVNIEWTPGHEGVTGNEIADQLAKDATDLDAGHERSTRLSTLRWVRERAMQAWRGEWKKERPTGRFATANRLPPKAKLKKCFFKLPREVFGRILQCCTGHCFTGEYNCSHIPSEPVDCPCGAALQTRKHIIQDCPRYAAHRHLLREASKEIDLPTILGADEGIDALAKFIQASGAFTKSGEPRPDAEEEQDEEPDSTEGYNSETVPEEDPAQVKTEDEEDD